jgi:hypothetical protein
LGDLEDVVLNYQLPESKNTYWMVTIHWTAKYDLSKVQLIAMLKREKHRLPAVLFPVECASRLRKFSGRAVGAPEKSGELSDQ